MHRAALDFFLTVAVCAFLSNSAGADEREKQRLQAQVELLKAQAAAQQVVIQAGNPYGGNIAVRQEVDPLDPIERVALLTSGGPVVVELEIYLDGKPFRIRREALVDELLAAADKDKDGTPTWSEAIANQRFGFGRLRAQNDQQKVQMIKGYDTNANAQVDRFEVRRFVAMLFQGGDFSLMPGNAGFQQAATLTSVLDSDKSGDLSAAEIEAATKRLKSRDANDDDVLAAAELGGPQQYGGRVVNRPGMAQQPGQTNLALLGPLADAPLLYAGLKQRYGEKEALGPDNFRLVPDLFTALDKDEDGTITEDEILGLNAVPPHVKVTVQLGKTEKAVAKISMEVISDAFKTAASFTVQDDYRLLIDMGETKYVLAASPGREVSYNYEASAKQLMSRYDADKNNYLEAKEMEGNLRLQFEMWDLDSDGKVYAEEIVSTYDRQFMPMRSQVRLTAAQQGDPLYQALDASGDSRLSLREMMGASARLKSLDKNQDGKLASSEIPPTIRLDFGTGADNAYGGGFQVLSSGGVVQGGQQTPVVGPDWYVHMDRNGDGDITPREFLGTSEQFKKLDSNGDGFIERSEAEAVK